MSQYVRGENPERKDRLVAVGVDKDKYSLQALHWAVDNFLTRGQTLRLVHVLQKPINPLQDESNVGGERQVDNQNLDLFLPLRSLCARKQIQCETVVLEETDVAKALVGYVNQYGIETLFVGAVSKTGISRLFKGTDTPSSILKLAPDFCNVYVIAKRKVAAARLASRPVPGRAQSLNSEDDSIIEDDGLFYDDEVSALDMNSSSGAGSDGLNSSLYQNLGTSLRSPPIMDPFRRSFAVPVTSSPALDLPAFRTGQKHHSIPTTLSEYSSLLEYESPSSPESAPEDNDETRRLRIELKQTMDMYHAACKEALAAKQQVMQLKEWKRRVEEKRKKGGTLSSTRKTRITRTRVDVDDESTQELVELEVQKRVEEELQKALCEAEERRKLMVVDDLGHSHLVVKYQSLFHILVVTFVFYVYFTLYVYFTI
ncbi:hypothetical protein ERO13_D13G211700v2 [Gossypium hirsutum]|uniref:RING-type E3 ubiquitin transferase n=2 Tax=Gossypium TaxID=3633 RepID=A0A1U8MFB4_GOSHI|nr:U-box domain-containing protein 51-like [Gossypium hirsutum]KAG4113257.1 hypothetical protein ERO13_D13G211700v2 [Gossypium hirsutum]TYH36347.1 hypothetical protein ES332_D13G258000v1 [Gossypium tomentosum]